MKLKLSKLFVVLFIVFFIMHFSFYILYFGCDSEYCKFGNIFLFLSYQFLELLIIVFFLLLLKQNKTVFFITLPIFINIGSEYFFKNSIFTSDYFDNNSLVVFDLVFSNIPIYKVLLGLDILQVILFYFFRNKLYIFWESLK